MRSEIGLALVLGLAALAWTASLAASTAGEKIDPAVLETGRRLLVENDCNGACHARRATDGKALSLYTPFERRIQTRADLVKQVEACVSHLGSMIFPEEIESVAAALDHDHYHFE